MKCLPEMRLLLKSTAVTCVFVLVRPIVRPAARKDNSKMSADLACLQWKNGVVCFGYYSSMIALLISAHNSSCCYLQATCCKNSSWNVLIPEFYPSVLIIFYSNRTSMKYKARVPTKLVSVISANTVFPHTCIFRMCQRMFYKIFI